MKVEDGINFYVKEHQPVIQKAVEEGIANNKAWDKVLMIVTTSGKEKWVRAIGYPVIKNGELLRLEGTFQDIDEAKKQHEELQKLTNRFELALEASKIGVWEYNLERNDIIWDDQMYQIYGQECSGNFEPYDLWEKGLHPDDVNRTEKELQDAIKNGAKFNTVFRIVTPTGEVRNIRAIARLEKDSDGKALRMFGVNWDVTEQVKLEENLYQEKERAEAASNSKSMFLANMSHEIRTPMNGILGMASLLNLEDLPEDVSSKVNVIVRSSQSLLAIINDILDISKLESGQMQIDMESFNLRDQLKLVQDSFLHETERR